MARTIIRKGDVFLAALDDRHKKYFQYVGLDFTQLNSQVIRVFKKAYLIEDQPTLQVVINDEIDFYAHVVVKWGIKMGLWEKVGNIPEVGNVNILFRNTNDYGKQVKVSTNWHTWRMNEPFTKVGKLEGDNRKAEIGVVVAPHDILVRMRTGKYSFVYPGV